MNAHAGPKIRIRILAVDDEKEITDLLVRHFTFQGYDISGVNDPEKALKMIEEENFQIVISDIVMPGLNGLELLRRIKEHNGGIQVIMITGYVTMHNILTAMHRGAMTVIFKPLQDLDRLGEVILHCIGQIQMWQNILKELGGLEKTGNPYA